MKVQNSFYVLVAAIILLGTFVSADQDPNIVSKGEDPSGTSASVRTDPNGLPARKDPRISSGGAVRMGRSSTRPHIVNWEERYTSGLERYGGVKDFSTSNLIKLMDNDHPVVRYMSAALLGVRKEKSAIPRLEKALSDKSLHVQRTATEALLRMGNRKGIKVMQDFCAEALTEYNEVEARNTADAQDPNTAPTRRQRGEIFESELNLLSTAEVLSRAGEVSAMPYLRRLLDSQFSSIRRVAIGSLSVLHEKDKSVLKDLIKMTYDENRDIREFSSKKLQRIMDKMEKELKEKKKKAETPSN